MSRYFIEVCYKGTNFKGFQIQENGITIQGELNKALSLVLKQTIQTTTSSRTDAGVHALQNFLHVDIDTEIPSTLVYNLNAILHDDIFVKGFYKVSESNHSRFDALSRTYAYHIVQTKNPFLKELAYFYPRKLSIELMNEACAMLLKTNDFTSFSKRHTEVNNFNCSLEVAFWEWSANDELIFRVKSNRFLRGMVRALVATVILVGRGKINLADFQNIIDARDCTQADFAAPAHGLFLEEVVYPLNLHLV